MSLMYVRKISKMKITIASMKNLITILLLYKKISKTYSVPCRVRCEMANLDKMVHLQCTWIRKKYERSKTEQADSNHCSPYFLLSCPFKSQLLAAKSIVIKQLRDRFIMFSPLKQSPSATFFVSANFWSKKSINLPPFYSCRKFDGKFCKAVRKFRNS